jgi:hypothetical protein
MRRGIKAIAKDTSLLGQILRRLIGNVSSFARIFSLDERLVLGAVPRIYYTYCVARAAKLALSLGYKEVSVLEFGVAGGNGLVALEAIKELIERSLPIRIRLFGFDIGSGLPMPVDFRDLPYHWQSGFYEMDVNLLRSRLKTAELRLGSISETVPAFVSQPLVDAPIGMISFDLDYYSSTVDAFRIFAIDHSGVLPRVMCYMDDVVGTTECYSDFTGERLAISEFNQQRALQKISPCYDFEDFAIERWQQKIMIYHDFAHPHYCKYVGAAPAEAKLPLRL